MSDRDNPSRVYRLSYAFPKGRRQPYPCLELFVPCGLRAPFEEQLRSGLLEHFLQRREYLSTPADFDGGAQQAFAFIGTAFGFRGCGNVSERDDEVCYSFPLNPAYLDEVALTLHGLMHLGDRLLADVYFGRRDLPPSNHVQLVQLSTRCDRAFVYGHAIHGEVYPSFRRWLKKYAKGVRVPKGYEHNYARPLPDVVQRAMRSTVRAIIDPESRKHVLKECQAAVNLEGRFILHCYGNACDVAIYPDSGYIEDPIYPVRFSCHNLDHVTQQMILLSGLAALTDFVTKDLE